VVEIDSIHADTFGKQESSAYNAHYMAKGYHPQILFDYQFRMLLDALAQPDNIYTGKD
jgi:hypothetical protein